MLAFQRSLLGDTVPHVRAGVPIERRHLANGAWLDHAPEWIGGADELFVALSEELSWKRRTRKMYEKRVDEPRLTTGLKDTQFDRFPVLREITEALAQRYGGAYRSCWMNLYRDGQDSVAWHGDRIAREMDTALVAIVSVGERRPFRLRPKGGGKSIKYELGRGDLLVMGGTCQRTWDHSVPKVRQAGPRMSLTFRPEGQDFYEDG